VWSYIARPQSFVTEVDFMALLHIPLDQIDEARLEALITSGAAESRTIDYKRTTYGGTHADYSEYLADVSSFANTSGGDLVLGIDATNGIPTAVTALTIDMDQEKLRLEQVARGGLQPRIANMSFQVVPIQSGGNVLVLRVPRSYNPPHRIIRQGSNRFWARSAAGKYEPDVNELRTLFNAGPQLADRIRNFRLDRIAKITVGQGPVRLTNGGSLIIHVVPLSAFE
jgi:Putative DNA-binding domain